MPARLTRKAVDPNASLPHLLHRANQAANELVARELSVCGMTPRQFVVMLAVSLNPGLKQIELARRTGIDRSTVGDLVTRLTERGVLECSAASSDRRASTVTLTREGSELLAACREGVAAAERTLLGRVPANRRSLVLAMLESLAGIEGAGPAKPARAPRATKPAKKTRRTPKPS